MLWRVRLELGRAHEAGAVAGVVLELGGGGLGGLGLGEVVGAEAVLLLLEGLGAVVGALGPARVVVLVLVVALVGVLPRTFPPAAGAPPGSCMKQDWSPISPLLLRSPTRFFPASLRSFSDQFMLSLQI